MEREEVRDTPEEFLRRAVRLARKGDAAHQYAVRWDATEMNYSVRLGDENTQMGQLSFAEAGHNQSRSSRRWTQVSFLHPFSRANREQNAAALRMDLALLRTLRPGRITAEEGVCLVERMMAEALRSPTCCARLVRYGVEVRSAAAKVGENVYLTIFVCTLAR